MFNCIVLIISKILSSIIGIFKKNSGNVVGKIAIKLRPNIIKYFKINCPVIAVTATNGKTTTNNLLSYIVKKNGKVAVSNTEGNNMETGIVTKLIKNSTITGKIKADFITLEVDESYVPKVFKKIRLDTLIVLDFFRDQLDRNGEEESLILKINEFLKDYKGNLILNNDDPNVARLGKANPENKNVYYFSVNKYEYATKEEKEVGEGKFCPFCKTRLEYEYYQYSHIGKFKCPKCGYGENDIYLKVNNVDVKEGTFEVENNDTTEKDNDVENRKGEGTTYKTLANSIYAIYNYSAALAFSKLYNLDAKEALATFKLDNGRCEEIEVKGSKTLINLAKNPTGANVSLRILNEDSDEKDLLFVLNDNIADGFDVSWIWDINFNIQNVNRIITSGKRAYDIAIRIKTSGFDKEKIEAYLDLDEAVKALYKIKGKKYVIANYTALQPTRKAIFEYKKNNL